MKEARSMERKVGSSVGALAPMLAPSSSDAGTGAGTYIRCSMNIELCSLNIHLLSRDIDSLKLIKEKAQKLIRIIGIYFDYRRFR